MVSDYPEILTLQQAASLLQISERTIQRMVKKGEIPGVQVGGQWRFDRDQLKALVRGEWTPCLNGQQMDLVEKETMTFGIDRPEAFWRSSSGQRTLSREDS